MNKHKIVIKSLENSPRLDYTLDFIFKEFFDCEYSVIDEQSSTLSHLNYGVEGDVGSINLSCSKYLFSDALIPSKNILKVASPDFDLLAMIFFQLSRAEEYHHQSEDAFNRFTSQQAILQENLSKPIIDLELIKLAAEIQSRFEIQLKRKESFRLIHTVDVDQVFAYKHKNLKRTLGGTVANVLKGNVTRLKDRTKSMSDGSDPYDTFELLKQGAQTGSSYYFILVGNYDEIDNALDIEKPAIQSKLLDLQKSAHIGVHPSVQSNQKLDLLDKEIGRLQSVIDAPISISRQHFLCLRFPQTYQELIRRGISEDFSLGYHDHPGFRAGTTQSFYWYDLEHEEKTSLLIHPLIVMDVSLKKYQKLSAIEAGHQIKAYMDLCKSVDGPFTLLWHNSSFYEEEGWTGWKETYQDIINYCQELLA